MWEFLASKFGLGKKIKKEIIINAESLETRVAVLENGNLEEFYIERPSEDASSAASSRGRSRTWRTACRRPSSTSG